MAAIRCGGIELNEVLEGVPVVRVNFPIKYLGLPLALGRLRKVDLQPVFDKIFGRVASWRVKNMAAAGRTMLESLEQLDKQRRRFLWAGTGDITGGKCKVNLTKTCMPTSQGGLGVLNLDKFTRALRLRWLWHEWKDQTKPWVGLETPCDEIDRNLFAASTNITIGDGNTVRFWESAWIGGRRPKDLMPLVYTISKNRGKSLRQGKEDDAWVQDLKLDSQSSITVDLVEQLVALWEAVRNVHLDVGEPDQITWKFTNNGHYTASSAYHAQCCGVPSTNFNSLIWKAWAPGKCKFHAWLIIQNRVWTSDRLATRGWQNNGCCPLCRRETETALHLVATCRYTKRIWHLISAWVGYQQMDPTEWEEA
uniref:OSJNBa0027G07.11 protein n=3 Tax=Oryza sativa subsp. japonica TaxID=39947 RepID=Q7XUX8_ORYSJ|nr:OSJNBa0027G07.11 [Oryza sativa Japonica Group]